MGTDIHMVVEVRKNTGWKRVNPPVEIRDEWLVEQSQKEMDERMSSYYKKRAKVTWYDDRNYDLFSILADVRNGYGFAGVPTGLGFNPISDPKGLPDDPSPEVKRLYPDIEREDDESDHDMWLGDHSYSWLTLEELDSYDWNQTTVCCGVIPWDEYLEWKKEEPKSPEEYCGNVSGPNIVVIDMRTAAEEGERLVSEGKDVHVRVSWEETYSQAAGERWMEKILPALRELGEPKNVRIIFGFDS